MTDYSAAAGDMLRRIRESRPVIHSITNFVVMNSTANVLLAMGASPIMAHAPEEMEDIVGIANAVVINIGTLSKPWIETMKIAAHLAKDMGKPLVLDPVGAGATRLRTETATELMALVPPSVVRGNASEILALAREEALTRGVDSVHSVDQAFAAARNAASTQGTVFAVTGVQDFVTDGEQALLVKGGHALMGYVTGTGCAASVIVAAFLAVESNPVAATAAALAFFGLAGERAAQEAPAPGTFWIKMLDWLYRITPDELASKAIIETAA